jgi:nitrite reductase/ring-hydroxylating ferredoxin subunit
MLVSFNPQGPLSHQWHPVARSCDVGTDAPVSIELLRDELVLWRGPSGHIIAAPDRCTHRKAELSLGEIKDGCLECPLHGWTFGEGGRCVRIPKRDVIVDANHLQTVACEEHAGLVWVCKQTALGLLPVMPADADPAFRRINASPMRWAASAAHIIETLLDRRPHTNNASSFNVPFTYRQPVPVPDGSEAHLVVTCSPVGAATSLVFTVLWSDGTARETEKLLEAQLAELAALQPTAEAISGMFEIDEHALDEYAADSNAWRRALLDAISAKV